jgi:DNA polymerase III delta prime subunit
VADTTQTAQELPSELYHQLHTEAASVGTQEVIDDIMGENTLVANTPKDDTPVSSLPRVTEGVHEDTVPESSLPQPAEGQSRSTTPPTTSQHAAVFSNEGPPPEAADNTTAKVTPKKQIKVTRTGKLVSSPPKPDPSISTTPKKRGRPRKAAKKANLSATITIIRYGSDSASRLAFGQQIDAILSGEKSSKGHTVVVPPKPAGPPKAPHPFFTGKAGQKKVEAQNKPDAESQLATPRKSAITPGKLLAERRKEQTDEPTPAFGILRNNRSVKQSGLHEPSWPSKETAHVRNLDGENASQPSTGPSTAGVSLKPAKLKSNVYTLPAEEEVITRLAQQLSEDMKINPSKTHSDFAPPEDVRLPMRSLTTGIDIQHKVRAQIRAPIETLAQRLYAKTHPAITTLYDDIEHTLTPFDEGICEPQAWAQKYRPGQADHVLQTGNQAFALKDWLQSLTVMAVGAVQDPSKAGTVLDTKRPPKKKRKTAVDNFIVSDDEDEEEEMVELDTNKITPSYQAPSLRRLRWTRNKNVVLISGPHGSGKSATVYAVAKELDFEVFELHSGVRRSGKDIQDKVGDMTANHLVNHKRNDLPIKEKVAPTAVDVDTDNERISTEFQKDLDSGRQGTMTSFFTAKPAAKPKPKPKPKAQVVVKSPAKIKTTPIAQATIPLTHSSRKSQKQSLILIEEADILFEEDQNFWTQIIKLAAQSKRPIVITCNDESQIPTQALPMAAILRLTPPPTDLATDYLVALAGREGHILQRQAISDLYNAKGHDLRASITEMNFWCQMSVGDKKGGLEWMYQRWPPGKDVDAHGRLLRVASEDTYQSGMGWLSHNVFEANPNIAFNKEVELLTEVWNDWGISPMSCNIEAKPTNKSVESDQAAELDKTSQLDQLVTFSDALSASDIFCRVDLPTYEDMYSPPIDATLPSITDKERLSYTIDAPLLQTDHQTDYLALDTSLATQTHLLVHRNFPHLVHRPGDSSSSTSTSLEQYYTHQILRHQTHNRADHNLTRSDCASAFDILASPSDQDHFIDHRTSYNLTPSSFDRTLSIITLDLAPYIRSIVAHEQGLEAQRLRLGNLLSEGGRAKRQRTTRASRTAMEGGERQSKRRERWFSRDLNFELVMRTAGSEWAGLGWKGEGAEEEEVSLTGTQNSEGLGGTQRSGEDGVEMLVDAEK